MEYTFTRVIVYLPRRFTNIAKASRSPSCSVLSSYFRPAHTQTMFGLDGGDRMWNSHLECVTSASGWVITFHCFTWMSLFIHTLIPMLLWLISVSISYTRSWDGRHWKKSRSEWKDTTWSHMTNCASCKIILICYTLISFPTKLP